MEISRYVTALREDLLRIAAVGDEATARAGELLAFALESAVGRRLQEALADAALELSAQLTGGRVEIVLADGEPQLVLVSDPPAPAPEEAAAASARITLRLPDRLKLRLESAATASGVSVNTWLVHALDRALESPPPTRSGRRLTGYGRA